MGVFKQKKQDVINKLKEFEFPELSASDDKKSYDYITTMPLFNLTQEKIDELNNKLKEKEEELDKVQVTTPVEMWSKELKELLKMYKKWYEEKTEEFNANVEDNNKIKKVKKNTNIKVKRRKSKSKVI